MNIFDRVNEFLENTEHSMVSMLTMLAPWFAPLAPAYLTYTHMTGDLGYPEFIALGLALVIEALGLATINTAFSFWMHNQRQRAKKNKAPVLYAVVAFAWYMSVVLMLVAVVDLFNGVYVHVVANVLIATLEIPAAVILALRAQHRDLMDEIKQVKRERKTETVTPPQPVQHLQIPQQTLPRDYRHLTDAQKLQIQTMTTAAIVAAAGVSSRTVRNWRAAIQEEQAK